MIDKLSKLVSLLLHHEGFSAIYSILYYWMKQHCLEEKYQKRIATLRKRNIKKNPIIRTKINGQEALCPFSHMLAFYQKQYPLYDRQLSKICRLIKETKGSISMIDVGANIGDTVLNIGIREAYYLLIEGEKSYVSLINKNLVNYYYSLENTFLTDDTSQCNYSMSNANGTGHLVQSEDGRTELNTLDILLEKYQNKKFDIIKIDTDGFDFKVIRGATDFLKYQQPLVFFEWDYNYLFEQNEDAFSIFPLFKELGYYEMIIFDNFGARLCKTKIDNTKLLSDLIDYSKQSSVCYYDILAIPEKWSYLSDKI